MPAYRDKRNGQSIWRWRTRFKLPNGEMKRLSGTPEENSRKAAEAEEAAAVQKARSGGDSPEAKTKETP